MTKQPCSVLKWMKPTTDRTGASPSVYGCLLLPVLLTLMVGCGDRSETVYREPAPAPSAQAVTAAPVLDKKEGDSPAGLTWAVPTGWEVLGAGGMRLASFHPRPGDETLLVTMVLLKGDAGGLVSNVSRWLEQMGEPRPSEAEVRTLLDAAEAFTTLGQFKGLVIDLTAWGTRRDGARPVILAAVLTVGPDSLFIKMSGPADLVTGQKTAFLALSRSLKPGVSP